jgi:ubiquinone/menaquinone biosynthesis C-methylase UbiE
MAHEQNVKESIKNWWTAAPMTYGSVHGEARYEGLGVPPKGFELGSREFFEQVDQTFYSWNLPLHTDAGYFSKIFPYEKYRGRSVLEIGCGMGTMAMNWVRHGANMTAVDLNLTSVAQTSRRFALFELPGTVLQADANKLPFPSASFDYLYSWGVLHHSPDLALSLKEAFRVLRPGGEFGIMLYNRRSLMYLYRIRYLEGYLHSESQSLSPLQLASRYTDGWEKEGNPYTWPVTDDELRTLFAPHARDLKIKMLGTELDNILPQMIPLPGAQRWLPKVARKVWARRLGWSIWMSGTKSD